MGATHSGVRKPHWFAKSHIEEKPIQSVQLLGKFVPCGSGKSVLPSQPLLFDPIRRVIFYDLSQQLKLAKLVR
jgi:hypothetical protein